MTDALALCVSLALLQPQLETTETSLGKKPAAMVQYSFAMSRDGEHIAFTLAKNGKECVVVDGVAGKSYTKIARWPLTEAGIKQQIIFSPNGQRVTYVAQEGGRSVVVLDGVEGAAFDFIQPGAPRFSPDGKRVFYTGKRGTLTYPVVDGKEGAGFDFISEPRNVFSLDGLHTLFMAKRGDKEVAVLDGKEIDRDQFHGHPAFSEGGRTSDVVMVGDKWVVYVDGKPSKPYDSVGNNVLFSKDYKHSLYRASDGTGEFVVFDGVKGKPYPAIAEASYKLSPDGTRYAFSVRLAAKSYVVADGKEGEAFEWVGNPEFSADSKSVVYIADKGGKKAVVQDGKLGEWFDEIDQQPTFSPVGHSLVYTGVRGEKIYVVRDGVATAYDEVNMAGFSPDGKRFVYTARTGPSWTVYIDGTQSLPSENPFMWPTFSKDGKRLAYLAGRGKETTVVLDGKELGEFEEVGYMEFTPDGKHLFCTVKRGDKWIIALDGVEGRSYDSIQEETARLDSSGAFHVLAIRGDEYFRVVVKPT